MKKTEKLIKAFYVAAYVLAAYGWCFYLDFIHGLPTQLKPLVLAVSILLSFIVVMISAFTIYALILNSRFSKRGLNRRMDRVKRKLEYYMEQIRRSTTKLYTLKRYYERLYKKKHEKRSHDLVLGVDLAKYFNNMTHRPDDRYGE